MPNRNYGWPNVHGFCDAPNETNFCNANDVVEPLVNWTPTIAPSDIIWYDHPSIPEFQNTLLMTVLKNKMLVKFDFSDDGLSVINQTEYFNNMWGRLRDICVSPDGKIYLATSGYSWPSQPPNEIIELSNDNYYLNLNETHQKNLSINKIIDVLGKEILNIEDYKGIHFIIYNDGSSKKKIK